MKTGPYDSVLDTIKLPRMVKIEQIINDDKIADVPFAVRRELDGCRCIRTVKGKTVAVAVGSRGIDQIGIIARETVAGLKRHGAKEVFLVPAMGSHGGCTSEGQQKVLEALGVTEDFCGAPIRSSMETVILGYTDDNMPVHFDKTAFHADYTVSIARIKPHTSFRSDYESGMVKMSVIGLGKQIGADYCHFIGTYKMPYTLPKIGKVSLEKSNLLLCLGLIENGKDHICEIKAVPKEEIFAVEPVLLKKARGLMPSIPIKGLDLLIVDEMGKNISGAGMDPNIIGRFTNEYMKDDPVAQRITVLDLTEESRGNVAGMGLADFATRRFYNKMDLLETYPNTIVSRCPMADRMPVIMENDRDAIRAGVKTALGIDEDNIRILRIKNTASLGEMEVSEVLLPEVRENPNLRRCSDPYEFLFDEDGNLVSFRDAWM